MAELGRYCKAYLSESLAAFPGWKPNLEALRPAEADGDENPAPREALESDDVLYLQESFIVTDGIFLDEHVIFDQVTDEWRTFCAETLAFAVPDDVLEMEQAAHEAVAEASAAAEAAEG